VKYYRPDSLAECLALLGGAGKSRGRPERTVNLLAGGTDLVPRYEQGRPLPGRLVDLKRLPELRGLRETEDGLEIGALTCVEDLKRSDLVRRDYQALWQAARQFAGVQIRHRATLGGNICNASPAGDTLPPLCAYGARLLLCGAEGERELPLEEFITGPGETTLKPGELLRAVVLPAPGGASMFFKLGLRDSMAIALASFALVYELEEGGRKFRRLELAAGAVAPTVARLGSVRTALMVEGASVRQAVARLDDDIAPIDDLRASARYRRLALGNCLEFSLRQILAGTPSPARRGRQSSGKGRYDD